jgi:two-component system chemotaxis sensor kinase CheA
MSLENDPLHYFRIEAQELLEQLSHGLFSVEEGSTDPKLVSQLFRYAHTLKGAARVVGQTRMAEIAHAMEDALSPFRDSGEVLPADSVPEFMFLVRRMGEELMKLHAPAPSEPEPEPGQRPEELLAASLQAGGPVLEAAPPVASQPASGGAPSDEVVRVELGKLDSLLEGLSEAVVQLGGLRAVVEALTQAQKGVDSLLEQLTAPAVSGGSSKEHARWLSKIIGSTEDVRSSLVRAGRQLGGGLGQVESELGRLRDSANSLRLVPAEALFGPMKLAAREAASALGRPVEVHTEGGDIQLDGHVVAALRQALMHVARNAVDHGLETPEERRALGKAPTGRFTLSVERRGSRVAVHCQDDGRGVDLNRVRQVALTRGLATAEQLDAMDEPALLDLLFQPGFSTARSITDVSGRGVGMDVVKETALRLKGEARMTSRPGLGSRVTVEVPLDLASLEVLGVESAGHQWLLPLEALSGAAHMPTETISWTGSRASITYEGQVLPFLPLTEALGMQGVQQRPRAWSVLILSAGSLGQAAVGVERLLGVSRRVSRQLPASVPALPLVAGASFDAQGLPLLLLDASGLVRRVQSGASSGPTAVRVSRKPTILVVDDSVTTRMLEKSILEAAGYTVELAASGEEGLEKVQRGGHALMISDVEMPGMTGVELTRRVRAIPALQSLPILMVSSLATEEDKQRGREAGVSAYIVKGEFQQHGYLDTVARLIASGRGKA